MRKLAVIGALISITGLYMGCSADDSSTVKSTGNKDAGRDGSSGAGGSVTGGAGGTGGGVAGGGMGGAGMGGAGMGGAGMDAGGMGGAGMGGMAGTVAMDPCMGRYQPLPYTAFTGFQTIDWCGGSTQQPSCTPGTTPLNFTGVPNPDCNQVIPDGGIYPFAEAGAEAGPDADEAGTTEAGSPEAGDEGETGAAADADAGTADTAEAAPDVSVTPDGGTEASSEGSTADATSDAPPVPACYEFLYNPACAVNPNGCWGGVIFTQSPQRQAAQGICIQAGATKITFWAKASRPDARIKFGAMNEGIGTTEFWMNITTEWAQYTITSPSSADYNQAATGGGVWNGFSVIVESQDHVGGTYIWVKDVVWSM
jgi:hypothetical protein